MQVLKIGGNELDQPGFLDQLARTVADMEEQVVIVHGGGKAIAEMQERLGIRPRMVDGLRVTDAESLMVAQMVLSGQTNKLIVAALLAAGVDAVGLSGVDGGLLRCVQKEHETADLGYVGELVKVRKELLLELTKRRVTAVISPISLGLDGLIYNVNADEVAGTLAGALEADLLTFVSDVPGVLDEAGYPISSLSATQTEALIQAGVIKDGMIPKVRTALNVVSRQMANVRIVNLAGLKGAAGTVFRGGLVD
jgi:acetylglutamate kinase